TAIFSGGEKVGKLLITTHTPQIRFRLGGANVGNLHVNTHTPRFDFTQEYFLMLAMTSLASSLRRISRRVIIQFPRCSGRGMGLSTSTISTTRTSLLWLYTSWFRLSSKRILLPCSQV